MTKEEIKEASTLELTVRMNRLMSKAEDISKTEKFSLADAEEKAEIEEELRRRLNRALGREVIPISPKPAPPEKKKIAVRFTVTVFSTFGSLVDKFTVDAIDKEEAKRKARRKIVKYPGRVNFKIG